MNILGICGSLRAGSFNRRALEALALSMPAGVGFETAGIGDLPLYDQDVQARGIPDAVTALADRIRAADAVVIATPEYNFSIPGPLKNAIDWVSRVKDQPFAGKTVGLIGASMGAMGAVRAQLHLRHVLVFLDGRPINKPEVLISAAHQKFDAEGKLTDDITRTVLKAFADSLIGAASAASRQAAATA
jgi:chromate reductase